MTWGYDGDNRLTSITDALGDVTTFSYDPAGNRVTEVDPRGNVSGGTPAAYATAYTYDSNNRMASRRDPLGNTTTVSYDPDGKIVTRVDPRGNVSGANPATYTTAMRYDALDRVVARTVPSEGTFTTTFDADGRAVKQTDPLGDATTTTYDAAGRVSAIADPDQLTTTFAYDPDGRRITMVDPRGNVTGGSPAAHTTRFGYDNIGRMASVTDPVGAVNTYGYDADGNQTATTSAAPQPCTGTPASVTVALQRDADGRVLATIDPSGRKSTYVYDGAGNRISETDLDATGNTIATTAFSYDAANRLTETDYPNPSGVGQATVVKRTYDSNSDLTQLTDPSGSTSFAYDAMARVTSISGPSASATYSYDPEGNLASTTAPDGTFSYAWRPDDLLASRNGGGTTGFGYDNAGRPSSVVDEAGRVDTTMHSAGGAPIEAQSAPLASAAVDFDRRVVFDADRNPTQITDGAGTQQASFSWDTANRLVGETYAQSSGTKAVAYNYDGAGNRIQRSDGTSNITYCYDSAGELKSSTESSGIATQYSYDGLGDLTQVLGTSTATYAWQLIGDGPRLTQATVGPNVVTFSYDGYGRRLTKKTTTTTTNYHYDGEKIESLTDALGNVVASFSYSRNGVPLAIRLPNVGSFYYHFDPFGSVDRLTSSSGNLAVTYMYDAFGNLNSSLTGPAWNQALTANPFTFKGAVGTLYDPELNLLTFNGRPYSPTLGRYLTNNVGYLPCWKTVGCGRNGALPVLARPPVASVRSSDDRALYLGAIVAQFRRDGDTCRSLERSGTKIGGPLGSNLSVESAFDSNCNLIVTAIGSGGG